MNRKEYTEEDYAVICQMLEQAYADRKNGKSVKEIVRQFTDKYPEEVVMAVIETVVAAVATIKHLNIEYPTNEMLEIMCKRGVEEMNKCLRKIQENENVKN